MKKLLVLCIMSLFLSFGSAQLTDYSTVVTRPADPVTAASNAAKLSKYWVLIQPRLDINSCTPIRKALYNYMRRSNIGLNRLWVYALYNKATEHCKVLEHSVVYGDETTETSGYKYTLYRQNNISAEDKGMIKRVQELTILEREKSGLVRPVLQLNYALSKVAQEYAMKMYNEGFYSHIDPTGKNPLQRVTDEGLAFDCMAENIYRSPTTPEQAVEGRMNSPMHKMSILNSQYTQIGIGIYKKHRVQIFACPK